MKSWKDRRRWQPIRKLLCTAVVLSLFAAPLWAQSVTLSGMVTMPGSRTDGAIVYLRKTDAAPAQTPSDSVIDQIGLRFAPKVLVVSPGTTVEFANSDPVRHNIFSPTRPERFDLGTYPPTETRFFTFNTDGVHVILCNIHPEMVAYVLVATSQYHTTVGRDSHYRLEGLDPGAYDVRVWHRRARPFSGTVAVAPGQSVTFDIRLERR